MSRGFKIANCVFWLLVVLVGIFIYELPIPVIKFSLILGTIWAASL